MSFKQRKKWIINSEFDQKKIDLLSEELDVSPLFVKLCLNRGLHSKEEIERFINPDESWFHDPFLLYDMEKVIERITSAIETGEKIMIYGDYDADGVTSTAILYETIEAIGGNVEYFIPNRFVEGYGPNKEAFDTFLNNETSLIITVDNGVAGHDAIHYIQDKGVDVVVTDHHELPETLPDAYAIIHPNHPKGHYPFKDLSGAGVALKVATALLGDFPAELLDLAAIGTIADLVSLRDENRAIVSYGLKAIRQTQRIGILSLFDTLALSLKEVDETTIGFKIAPPINAIGRIENASPVVELLTTFDEEKASKIAALLENKNKERKTIVSDIFVEAMNQLVGQEDSLVNILAKENWHPGVLGIVASKIVHETGKPTIILNIDSETGEAKGSGRSIKAFNLFKHCNDVRGLFRHFGGHHMAAGMTLPIENISVLHEALNEAAKAIQETTDFFEEIEIEEECAIADISLEAIKEIDSLKPFGTENPRPAFLFSNVHPVESRAIGVDHAHLKLKVSQEDSLLDIIAFNYGGKAEALKSDSSVSVVGTLEINEWNGNKKPQLQLMDLDFQEAVILDKRTSELKKSDFSIKHATYVFFNKKNYAKYSKYVTEESQVFLIENIKDAEDLKLNTSSVLVDCPDSLELLKYTLEGNKEHELYCIFYANENNYLLGMPSREQFTKLYKFLAKHKSIDLKEKGALLSKYLNFDKSILKFIIRVFLEAGFVTIEDGLLNINAEVKKMDVADTQVYKQRKEKIKVEELLIYSSFNELTKLLKSLNQIPIEQ
ncbi:single-stranded-DNA-specific exonuclease RecJ [Marinilactibacillus psychrotolerans]|uniref:Single-stranded-DNA-specific exonuclease RecJ n=1 Tax=Marinilactibacillus psychrotolerans TaxID=191770 RepID=A0AAV3WWR3_9LACT|nr:single-stranded-DNA-specific exonuclease RecJ [Marinilactibacillus psychrotolerans]GEL67298.1 single-stranded-DNA-specific exonuclease RecJ [Marinilactibacillus psychrotolerans]GEQ36102.1 single-stranded-DNA-specific exonuclease RecJ [Marinilactibacillus psychrotolerans]SDC63720.1 single-stranded-DNA-specific exonuclease [Marinilactibacillus psychrotolerans]